MHINVTRRSTANFCQPLIVSKGERGDDHRLTMAVRGALPYSDSLRILFKELAPLLLCHAGNEARVKGLDRRASSAR